MQQTAPSLQQDMMRRRLPLVVAVLLVAAVLMVVRMITFQLPPDPRVAAYVNDVRNANYGRTLRQTSDRGLIYDRSGQPMAVNTLQYRLGLSPNLVSNPELVIQQLSGILDRDPLDLQAMVSSDRPWELLAARVSPETWRRIDQTPELALSVNAEPVPGRYYPQGTLASQVIGFMAGDGVGYLGVEGFYQQQLAGRTRDQEVSTIPFDLPEETERLARGSNLVLTIDRDVQFMVETVLAGAIAEYGAAGGTIIVMNPRTGDVLAMASSPTYDPNSIPNDPRLLRNPAIADVYEPGSVFKVLTVAAALETGDITPTWTYNDTGSIQVGSRTIRNWDRAAYGLVDVTTVLVDSLNVGAATIAVDEMGWEPFYSMLGAFGIGQSTGVDLQGEEAGILRTPTSSSDWSESDLGANSYGQGVSVTPLQMLTAINAIANGGLIYQPRIVSQIVNGSVVQNLDPVAMRKPITAETAQIVSAMMVATVENGVDNPARLPGYTIAGKTGTAEIANAIGYEPGAYNMTFVGFLPADDPQLSVLVLIRRPARGQFASQVAAPVFRDLVERLVLLLEIPNDETRYRLGAQGGSVSGIDR